jgi:fructose-bisphosphate aldolase class II
MRSNLTEVLSAVAPGAAGSFNVLDLDMALAVLDSAEALGLPVIVGIASRHFEAIRAHVRTASILKAIEGASVPAALHLDHAAPDQLALIRTALDLGFSSVMIDGSKLPLQQNVEVTAQVVEIAHRYGASVEGELGGIAGEEGVADTGVDAPQPVPYTDADEAEQFAHETEVDALAVAVGTAHGLYADEPKISFDSIRTIARRVSVPLVLHGASGVPDDAMRRCVDDGIRKINYFSGLLKTAMDRVRSDHAVTNNDWLGFKSRLTTDWQREITEQMQLYARRRAGDTSSER